MADWRRRIAELYARVRGASDPAQGWAEWCAARAALFAGHPQSPLAADRRTEAHLPRYFPYDPAYRVLAEMEPVPAGTTIHLAGSTGEPFSVVRIGVATFTLQGVACRLGVHWLTEYSGGLYIAFRDATSGAETYGAGRYLLDTAKGADLGAVGDRLVLDLNFAYQPSCSYDERWSCPLPPPDSTLAVRVEAGERTA